MSLVKRSSQVKGTSKSTDAGKPRKRFGRANVSMTNWTLVVFVAVTSTSVLMGCCASTTNLTNLPLIPRPTHLTKIQIGGEDYFLPVNKIPNGWQSRAPGTDEMHELMEYQDWVRAVKRGIEQ